MLVIPGSSALLAARRETVLKAIRSRCSTVLSVDAIYIHLVKCTSESALARLSDANSSCRTTLSQLLDYGDGVHNSAFGQTLETHQNIVYVLPRPGTISPWS